MSAAELIADCHRFGLTIRRYGSRIELDAPKPPPADRIERLREAKPVLLSELPDDGPEDPCERCGGKAFWRQSMTDEPWRCRRCIPSHPSIACDGAFFP